MRTVPHFFHKPRQKLLKFIEILGLNNVLNGQTATSTTKGGLLGDEGTGAGKGTHLFAQIIGYFLLGAAPVFGITQGRSEEHTSELQSRPHLVCRLLLEKKKKKLIHCQLLNNQVE